MAYSISSAISDSKTNVYIYENAEQKMPLNSLYSPEKEAIRFLGKLNEIKSHLVIFIGFGNGALLENLVESGVYEKNTHFLFLEPFTEVELNENQKGVFQTRKKISFIYSGQLSSVYFADFLSNFSGIPITIQIHPNYIKLREPKIKECLKIINEGIETRQILNVTEMTFALDWILEPILNIPSISKSINIKELKGKFKGERAMLLASGPSLKSHINYIEENKEGFHLFALGPSLRALLEKSISPDFTLSIDSSEVNYETHFKGLDYDGVLIYETVSNSKIQSNHQGELIVAKSKLDHSTLSLFPDLHSFTHSSPSVAIFALQVIEYLGFSEVYFIGQDLALVDGSYYAEGIGQHEASETTKEELTVESNQGSQVGTTKSLKIFLEMFEYVIKKLRKDLKIYNLSEKGAKIEGANFIEQNSITVSEKNHVGVHKDSVYTMTNPEEFIKEFIRELRLLENEVKNAKSNLNKYLKKSLIKSEDMEKVLIEFRSVTTNEILKNVILSHLTFLFSRITNTFEMLKSKKNHTSKDYFEMLRELERFYSLIFSYCKDLLKDERLN